MKRAMALVFKICPVAEWDAAKSAGLFKGSAVDLRDGFIHFSAEHQWRQTAALHFAGQSGLVLAAFDESALGPALKWEPSRGGDLFPHLHATLDPAAALWVKPLESQ